MSFIYTNIIVALNICSTEENNTEQHRGGMRKQKYNKNDRYIFSLCLAPLHCISAQLPANKAI